MPPTINEMQFFVQIFMKVLRSVGLWAKDQPALRGLTKKLFRYFPGLRWRIWQFLFKKQKAYLSPFGVNPAHPSSTAGLPDVSCLKEDLGRFAGVASIHKIVDVEILRARIDKKTRNAPL